MINSLIRLFLSTPLLAALLAAVLLIFGWRSFEANPKDAIPDIAENQVIVFSEWMGRSPKDVDEQVTYPLTVALQGVPDVREIRATSGFGWSIVYVVFHDGVDFYWARSRVLERLNVAQGSLPDGVTPRLGPDATALGQVFWYTVENGWYSPDHPGLRFDDDGTLTPASRAALAGEHRRPASNADTGNGTHRPPTGSLAGEHRRPAGNSFDDDGTLTPASRAALAGEHRRPAGNADTGNGTHRPPAGNARSYADPISGAPLQFSTLPLDRLRSLQDFDVKLALEGVEGVSEVASIGGYVRQYQIDVDPEALRAFNIPLGRVIAAVRNANLDVGAKVIEENGMELLVRGIGFLGGDQRMAAERADREAAVIRDIENIVVHAQDGTPIYVHQLATVGVGPDFRRGVLDKLGAEAVGGCVTMRFGENPLVVIERVKAKIDAIERGLPPGVRINAFYDRTQLIDETMGTLTSALSQELLITVVAVVLFLLHFRSSLVIAVTLPLAVGFAFICMEALGLPSTIMSLAGIAIAIGTMVDMGIVMVENIYQYLTDARDEYLKTVTGPDGRPRTVVDSQRRRELVRDAATEVGPAIVTAIATTVISFIPVFFLEGQAQKLFTPLAWTKTFCMVGAVILALTIVPPLAGLLLRHRRPSWTWSLAVAGAAGIATAWLWSAAPAWHAEVTGFVNSVNTFSGWSPVQVGVALGAAVFLVTLAALRERIRPIEQNPTSRLIHRVYEPTLRWILNHKLLFLCLPAALVLWGLGIWLGWRTILGPLVGFLEAVNVPIAEWSALRWLALAVALFAGFGVAGLIADTLRTMRYHGAERVPTTGTGWRWGRRGISVAVAVVVFFGVYGLARNLAAGAPAAGEAPRDTAEAAPSALRATLRHWRDYRPVQTLLDTRRIGQQFMPPLDEGDFLYMPSVLPPGSITTVQDVMQKQDVQFMQIPEVAFVVGKAGRTESPLDPAPLGMLETVIALKPRSEWPVIDDPQFPGMQRKRTMDEIWADIQEAGSFPGVTRSAQLQPIRTRVEMLSTGLNAPIGIKIYGDSLERCETLAVQIEQLLREPLADVTSAVNAVRVSGKPYVEIRIEREAIARYGVNITDVQQVIEVAIGGRNLVTTYEGLDRYPVRIRYARELRDEVQELERVLVPTPAGAQIPLGMVAQVARVTGPMSVRREGAKFVSYVTMSAEGIDDVSLVDRGRRLLDEAIVRGDLELPEGYSLRWAGTYERNVRAKQRLALLVPLVLLINFLLIYMQFKRWPLTIVIFLAIPVAFSGGFILLDWWPQIQDALYTAGVMDRPFPRDAMYLTVAVWVGFIALFGIAVDDGIVMGTYLDQTFGRRRITRYEEIEERVVQAGLRRIRPCLMTTFTTLVALLPVLLTTGRGSDVMAPMALPVFGGMVAALVTLFVVPTCFCGIKQLKWRLNLPDRDFERPPATT